jgi:ABC-type Fe3+/spermidine/putrescine transport system ATPase subunit
MTLRQNLLFAVDRLPRLERHRKVNEMIERFHLSGVAGRRPHEVSGGEKQRCSIARALIGGPKLLLLDEPARGLDAPLRAELYAVIRRVRADFGLPVLLVTHDLDECFALGDEMLVLREGKVIQSGRPRQVFDHPATLDIARLLGIANIFPVEIAALDPGRNTSLLRLEFGEMQGLYYPGRLRGDRVWMCVGPEQLRIARRSNGSPEPNQIPLRLLRVSEKPEALRLEFEGGIVVETPREEFERQKDNQEWLVEFPPHALRIIG